VAAVFAVAGKDVVWSSYRGSWQQLPVETHTWPWPRAIVFLLAIIFGPILLAGRRAGARRHRRPAGPGALVTAEEAESAAPPSPETGGGHDGPFRIIDFNQR
jgi:hypothetical protein